MAATDLAIATKTPIWDAGGSSFDAFAITLEDFLSKKKLVGVLFHEDYELELNTEPLDKASVFGILRSSVEPIVRADQPR